MIQISYRTNTAYKILLILYATLPFGVALLQYKKIRYIYIVESICDDRLFNMIQTEENKMLLDCRSKKAKRAIKRRTRNGNLLEEARVEYQE